MALETPITRPTYTDYFPSAMKGVVLTTTGATLSTPAPSELAKLFDASPKVGFNFAKIFDFDENEKATVSRIYLALKFVAVVGNEGGSEQPSPQLVFEREVWRWRTR